MTGPGRLLAQRLVAAGEAVVDVPPKLAARVRLFSVGQARKTDLDDATSVARAALRSRSLQPVAPEGTPEVLRLLTDRRNDLTEERTRTVNRGTNRCRTWCPAEPPAS